MWHSVLWSISSQETTLWCEPYFDMWVFRWAGRCVNTRLPGLSMTFNNRIWSLSQHFIQALNLKVEPRDFKKFMIPQTQGIFPHDRYLRTKSVKPALCGLALFAWAPALGCSEVSSKLPWLRVSPGDWGGEGARPHPHPCPRTGVLLKPFGSLIAPLPILQPSEQAPECPVIKIVFRLERVIADTHYYFPGGNQSRQILWNLGQQTRQIMVGADLAFGLPCEAALSHFQDSKCLPCPQYPQSFPPSLAHHPDLDLRGLGKTLSSFPAARRLWGHSKPLHCEAPRTGGQWISLHPRRKKPIGQTTFTGISGSQPLFIHSFIRQYP